jgi:hypothetical protein
LLSPQRCRSILSSHQNIPTYELLKNGAPSSPTTIVVALLGIQRFAQHNNHTHYKFTSSYWAELERVVGCQGARECGKLFFFRLGLELFHFRILVAITSLPAYFSRMLLSMLCGEIVGIALHSEGDLDPRQRWGANFVQGEGAL